MAFERYGIPVFLNATGETVMVVTNAAADKSVVFADPAKLTPHMDAINRRETASYLSGKRRNAAKGIMEARTAADSVSPIPGPRDNPLPMGQAHCSLADGKPVIRFSDGATRTDLLIDLKAKFVPLEVPAAEANLLHQTVGGKMPPKPVEHYMVPSNAQAAQWDALREGTLSNHRPLFVRDEIDYARIARTLRDSDARPSSSKHEYCQHLRH